MDQKKLLYAAIVLSFHDIKKKYRRTVIGPWWITLGLAVQIILMGFVFARLFGQSLRDYLPYLAIGIVIWNLLISVITESIDLFINNSNFIKQVNVSLNFHLFRCIFRNVIIFLHNFVVVIPLLFLFKFEMGFNVIVSLLGLALFILNLYWISVFVAIFATRFRDVGPIVLSLMQVFFYLTPIIWKARDFSESRYAFLIEFNPVGSLFSIARNPLLGLNVGELDYIIVLLVLLVGTVFSSKLLKKFKNKIIFWI